MVLSVEEAPSAQYFKGQFQITFVKAMQGVVNQQEITRCK